MPSLKVCPVGGAVLVRSSADGIEILSGSSCVIAKQVMWMYAMPKSRPNFFCFIWQFFAIILGFYFLEISMEKCSKGCSSFRLTSGQPSTVSEVGLVGLEPLSDLGSKCPATRNFTQESSSPGLPPLCGREGKRKYHASKSAEKGNSLPCGWSTPPEREVCQFAQVSSRSACRAHVFVAAQSRSNGIRCQLGEM